MKKLSFVFLIIIFFTFGCANKNMHPPKSVTRTCSIGSSWVNNLLNIAYSTTTDYASTTATTELVVIENLVMRAIDEGLVNKNDHARKDYLRKFYQNFILKSKEKLTRQEIKENSIGFVNKEVPPGGLEEIVALDPDIHYRYENALVVTVPINKNGHFEIAPYGGGWSNWPYDDACTEKGPYAWSIMISRNDSNTKGRPYPSYEKWLYQTPEEAFESVKDSRPYKFVKAEGGVIRLWLNTLDEEPQNQGFVKVKIKAVNL